MKLRDEWHPGMARAAVVISTRIRRIEQGKMRFLGMKQFGTCPEVVLCGICVGFIAIQFVPVNRTNPPVEGDFRPPAEVVSVLRRACYDCHSNEQCGRGIHA